MDIYKKMKTKLEKYINYVVEDLVKNTRIDYDNKRIYPPFSSSLFIPFSFFSSHSSIISFSPYIQKRYGARDEEIQIIWDLYRERIKELIDNE